MICAVIGYCWMVSVLKWLCTSKPFRQSPLTCGYSNPRRWHIQWHDCSNYSDRLLVSISRRLKNYALLVEPVQLAAIMYDLCSYRVLLNGLCTKVAMYFETISSKSTYVLWVEPAQMAYSDRLLVSILRRMRNYALLVQPAKLAGMVYYLCS